MNIPLQPDSNAASILNARPGPERSRLELITAKIESQLIAGSHALDQILGPPILKARIAVTLLQQVASHLDQDLEPQEIRKIWSSDHQNSLAGVVANFRSAFSLHSEVLQGFESRSQISFSITFFYVNFFLVDSQ